MAPARFVIVGGGPAGVEAAATAARLGGEVTLVEAEILGGAANLWDCIPSKAMIATGTVAAIGARAAHLGLSVEVAPIDLAALRRRLRSVAEQLAESTARQLESQGVRLVRGRGRLLDAHHV